MSDNKSQVWLEETDVPTPQIERDEVWILTIKDGRASFRREIDGHTVESYRPTDLDYAIVDAASIIQGYQPPRGRRYLDKPVRQTQSGQVSQSAVCTCSKTGQKS
jgi:hypothetical protein